MDFMEIITLLLILVPIAGKLIEKSLKSAGKVGQHKKIHDVLEPFYDNEDENDEEAEESVIVGEAEIPAELLEGSYKSIKDIVRERQEARKTDEKHVVSKKLDIDPKKLVIYSEIMNTKF